jgi:hypothetical protein
MTAGNGEQLSRLPVTILIRTDRTGRIDVIVSGPIKGKAGTLTLLDAAKKIVQQRRDDPTS